MTKIDKDVLDQLLKGVKNQKSEVFGAGGLLRPLTTPRLRHNSTVYETGQGQMRLGCANKGS